MKKTILSLYLDDLSFESKYALLEFYRFAIFSGVDDIVLMTHDILKSKNRSKSLKEFLDIIPELNNNCRTHVLLAGSDARHLSYNDCQFAIRKRKDIDLTTSSKMIMNFEGRRINCLNGFDKVPDEEKVEDLDEVIYQQDPSVDVTIVASSNDRGLSRKYLENGYCVLYVAPLKSIYQNKGHSTPLIGFNSVGDVSKATAFYNQLSYDKQVLVTDAITDEQIQISYQNKSEMPSDKGPVLRLGSMKTGIVQSDNR